MYVVSLVDYIPTPRFDAAADPWTEARIEESASQDGPWTILETVTLSPVDPDPANPLVRNFTTDLATLPEGWYRVVFLDASGDQQPTTAVNRSLLPQASYTPTLREVAARIRARTRDSNGNELGTFTEETRPSAEEAQMLISQGAEDVVTETGVDVPERAWGRVRNLIALRAAMLIELSFFPEQIERGQSAYNQLRDLYGTTKAGQLMSVLEFVREERDGAEGGAVDEPGSPVYSFPVDTGGMVGWETKL